MTQPDHTGTKPPPNQKLEAARKALPSPSGAPGMCMSRRELAEAANTYVWKQTRGRQRTTLSERDIGRYERGEAHWPDHWRRLGLRGVLGVDSDTEIGFYPTRKTRTTPSSRTGQPDTPAAPDASPAQRPHPRIRDLLPPAAAEGVAPMAATGRAFTGGSAGEPPQHPPVERVACLAAQESWRHAAGAGTGIGRYVTGESRWPGPDKRQPSRTLLGATDDTGSPTAGALARVTNHLAANGTPDPPAADYNGRTHESARRLLCEHAADELRERMISAAAVDKRVLELLVIQSDHIREVDRRLGTRVAKAQLHGHLEALDQLRTFAVAAPQRQPLADLYSDAAALAGWQCLDLGDLDASWRHYEASKYAGHEGSSPAGLIHAIAEQAYVLAELGEVANAADLVEHAWCMAGTAVPALLLAWISAVQGELQAMSGHYDACRKAFDTAQRLLPTEPRDPDLPYIFLDDVHLARWRGNALARLGDPTAIDDLQNSLSNMDHSFSRARAGIHVDLAHALLAARRHDEARAELNQASNLAVRVGSARQHRRVRNLESLLHTTQG